MKKIIYSMALCLGAFNTFAWNAAGHKVVAQIAYDNLSPGAKIMCDKYLKSSYRYSSANARFVASSIWMDQLRRKKIYWYDVMHYIDIPFSNDGSSLPPIEKTNAVWAINQAMAVLSSKKASLSDKKFALRMLIHVVGDLHQPLHAITRVSAQLPNGDLGGNLFPLANNPVGSNLHQYWDNGAGFFVGQYNANQVKSTAQQLEQKWSCASVNTQENPEQWSKMSYNLALNNVYQINPKEAPNEKYQANSQILVQKQVVFAGCRLATLLNRVAQN